MKKLLPAFSKAYTVVMIVILLIIIAMQHGKILGHNMVKPKDTGVHVTKYTINDIKSIFKDATKYAVKDSIIEVFNGSEQIGRAYNTSPYSDFITGYASSVPILMGYNMQNKLEGLKLLPNAESGDFIVNVLKSGLMKSWDNLSAADVLTKKVDAVSGATESSAAIIKTLRHSTAKLLNKSAATPEPINYLQLLKTVLGVILMILALIQFFMPKLLKSYRIIYKLAVVLILGFWSGTFLSSMSTFSWAVQGMDITSKLFVFVLLCLSVILPIVTNKAFYCSYLCPFGASQDLLGKLRKKRVNFPDKLKQFLSTLREKVFAVIVFLLVLGVSFDLTNVEPFSAFLFKSASMPIIILAIVFLCLSIFVPRPWCNYVCPTGYLLEIIRKPKRVS